MSIQTSGKSIDSHDQQTRRWPYSKRTDWLAFAWGFAEGSLFFLVPDILLTISAAHAPMRSLRHMMFVIAGSIVAGLCLFACAMHWPAESASLIDHVPFVPASMFDRVSSDYEAHGAFALVTGPTSGIPYKVYAVLAPAHVDVFSFTAWSVPARAERLLITWAQFAVLGWIVRRYSKRPVVLYWLMWGVYWCAVYGWYWSCISQH